MKKVSVTILLTFILTVGSFARPLNMSTSQILQFEAEVKKSVKILENNTPDRTRFKKSEIDRAVRTLAKACEMLAYEGSAESMAFGKKCLGYLSAYDFSNLLVNVACYVPRPAESNAPKPKAPKTSLRLNEPGYRVFRFR